MFKPIEHSAYTNTTLTPLRKALRMRGVKGLPGHKKLHSGLRSSYSTKCSRNVAHTPDTQKCGVFKSVHLKIRSAYVADFLAVGT
jgi:hypothetical protein